jgi:hypothetical protein
LRMLRQNIGEARRVPENVPDKDKERWILLQ